MITYEITYSNGSKEWIKGYNIIQALGTVKWGLDNIISLIRL